MSILNMVDSNKTNDDRTFLNLTHPKYGQAEIVTNKDDQGFFFALPGAGRIYDAATAIAKAVKLFRRAGYKPHGNLK